MSSRRLSPPLAASGMFGAASLALMSLLGTGCGEAPASKGAAPAKVEHPVTEADLTTVVLTAEAERRLGIEVVEVALRALGPTKSLGGDVIPRPGHVQTLVAPAAGVIAVPPSGQLPLVGARVQSGQPLMRLVPLPSGGDLMRMQEELQAAEARFRQVELEAARAERLFSDRLISAREREKAQADLAVARAALDAAKARADLVRGHRTGDLSGGVLEITAPEDAVVRTLFVGAGQTVAGGTPLVEVVRADNLWVRVAIYVGDLARVDARAPARVLGLGGVGSGAAVIAQPVASAPVADPSAASADLYYALPPNAMMFRPGARVQVAVPMRGTAPNVATVPIAAVIYDAEGGAWVYERTGPQRYARRRVQLGTVSGGWVALIRGPAVGANVVTAGAAELFGTEFGAGK